MHYCYLWLLTAVTEDEAICALMVHETAVEHTTAKTGREAKLAVSKMALRRLEAMDREAFREEMGCTCGARDGGDGKQERQGSGAEAQGGEEAC